MIEDISADWSIISGPYQYIHVLDQNSNVTRLEEGPQVFVRRDHEKVVQEKRKHIIIPPRHYCVIENPVLRNEVSFWFVEYVVFSKLDHMNCYIGHIGLTFGYKQYGKDN